MGDKAVKSIIKYFTNNISEFNDLCTFVNVQEIRDIKHNTPLSGKTLVFTGTLENLSRSEAKNLAENAGALIASQLSPRTDILVAGERPGSKLKKAKGLLVEIMDEKQFLSLFNRT